MSASDAQRDARIARAVERWFARSARDLPWRESPRDPYVALVAEAMLQQTQASRVAERLPEFLSRFPDVRSLARASDDAVRVAWSGLGYYRRATSLRDAARAIVRDHAGRLPRDPAALRALPGVGRYSAGSLASIVFGVREPMVDANVARVLARLDGFRAKVGSAALARFAWERSAALVAQARSPGALNEGLMELGAVICAPRSPRCCDCPLRRDCAACAQGCADAIPAPRAKAQRAALQHAAVIARDERGRVLVEQRGSSGLWAGLWQPPTLERAGSRPPTRRAVERFAMGLALSRCGRFTHATTHRLVRFIVWRAAPQPRRQLAGFASARRGRWIRRGDLENLPLASPHRRMLLEALDTRSAPPTRADCAAMRL